MEDNAELIEVGNGRRSLWSWWVMLVVVSVWAMVMLVAPELAGAQSNVETFTGPTAPVITDVDIIGSGWAFMAAFSALVVTVMAFRFGPTAARAIRRFL